MSELRPVPIEELDAIIELVANAYPGIGITSADDKQRYKERLEQGLAIGNSQIYGLYRTGKLLGGMRVYDYTMNLFGSTTLVGGVGMVAVDLLHKKEKVAYELVQFFLNHYRDKGAALTALYPFRPDFYRQMGFGYGTKLNQYRFQPASLPPGSKDHVRFLTVADAPALHACYSRYAATTHGMFTRTELEFDRLLARSELKVVGYVPGERIEGYVTWTFQRGHPDNFLDNAIKIEELVYENRAALLALLAFLRSQADQINTIILNTSDDQFHHLLLDPRNGMDNIIPHVYHPSNVQGVGLMYRVIDLQRLWEILPAHHFGHQTCTLKLTLDDSFLPRNAGSIIVRFEDGQAQVSTDAAYDVELRMAVGDFSALVLGTTDLRSLHTYGLAELENLGSLPMLHDLFRAETKPVCLTRF